MDANPRSVLDVSQQNAQGVNHRSDCLDVSHQQGVAQMSALQNDCRLSDHHQSETLNVRLNRNDRHHQSDCHRLDDRHQDDHRHHQS
jgi:hypothetical protein